MIERRRNTKRNNKLENPKTFYTKGILRIVTAIFQVPMVPWCLTFYRGKNNLREGKTGQVYTTKKKKSKAGNFNLGALHAMLPEAAVLPGDKSA